MVHGGHASRLSRRYRACGCEGIMEKGTQKGRGIRQKPGKRRRLCPHVIAQDPLLLGLTVRGKKKYKTQKQFNLKVVQGKWTRELSCWNLIKDPAPKLLLPAQQKSQMAVAANRVKGSWQNKQSGRGWFANLPDTICKSLGSNFFNAITIDTEHCRECTGQENHRDRILKAKRQTVLPHSLGKSGSLASSATFPEHPWNKVQGRRKACLPLSQTDIESESWWQLLVPLDIEGPTEGECLAWTQLVSDFLTSQSSISHMLCYATLWCYDMSL